MQPHNKAATMDLRRDSTEISNLYTFSKALQVVKLPLVPVAWDAVQPAAVSSHANPRRLETTDTVLITFYYLINSCLRRMVSLLPRFAPSYGDC